MEARYFHTLAQVGPMYALKQLYELQELDLKHVTLETSLADVSAKLADDSALSSTREVVARTDADLEEVSSRRRASERTITQLQEALEKIESRLYSGAITNPRELSAAEEEREFIVRQQREEEDKLLDLMVEAEDLQSALAESREKLARLEADTPAEKARLLEEKERLTNGLATLGKARDEAIPQMEARSLSIYESLRKSKNGYAVAKVERGMCQGCRLTLSTMELQRARGSHGIVQCSSCSRILYLV